jgi:hypothetical protein
MSQPSDQNVDDDSYETQPTEKGIAHCYEVVNLETGEKKPCDSLSEAKKFARMRPVRIIEARREADILGVSHFRIGKFLFKIKPVKAGGYRPCPNGKQTPHRYIVRNVETGEEEPCETLAEAKKFAHMGNVKITNARNTAIKKGETTFVIDIYEFTILPAADDEDEEASMPDGMGEAEV